MRGTAVLVHGMWSSPADWRWVAERLRDNDVEVVVPNLPSHRTGSVGLTADAAEVRRTIASARPPVVAVGWSYGCDVIHEAAAGEPSVTHLVYIAGIPNPDPGVFSPAGSEAEEDPHILVFDDGTFVLDTSVLLPECRRSTRRRPGWRSAVRRAGLEGVVKVSQRPQQHGPNGAERQHAAPPSPASRTVAPLVELATGSGSASSWSLSPLPRASPAMLLGFDLD
jgi:pimeloyl-ACP methyl ester carboxylesterase